MCLSHGSLPCYGGPQYSVVGGSMSFIYRGVKISVDSGVGGLVEEAIVAQFSHWIVVD